MQSQPDEGYRLFGAEALLKRSQALAQEIEGVRKAEDIECVHRMRVASRRLRAAFSLFEDCVPRKRGAAWIKETRQVTRALGAARDTDVQIEAVRAFLEGLSEARLRPGVERLILRLRQQRDGLQKSVIDALDRLELCGMLPDMEQSLRQSVVQARVDQAEERSPETFRRASIAIQWRLEELLSYESCVPHPERVAELHAMRIAAKRLRYTIEIFAPLYDGRLKGPLQAARDAQELLGDIHDCDVWTELLPRFAEEERARTKAYFGHSQAMRRFIPGIEHLEGERRKFRGQRYKEFVTFWEGTRAGDTWGSLRRALQAPPPAAPTGEAEG